MSDDIEFEWFLCVNAARQVFMLGKSEINETFMCRLWHEDDDDSSAILNGTTIGDGCGPWSGGAFEFFGDADDDWMNYCITAAANQLGKWSREGRLTRFVPLWTRDEVTDFGNSIGWPDLPTDLMRNFGKFVGRKIRADDETYATLKSDYNSCRPRQR